MPNCPKCGDLIDHLVYWAYELRRADFYVTRGKVNYDKAETADVDVDSIDYDCPKCDETLFHSEEDAKKFLS